MLPYSGVTVRLLRTQVVRKAIEMLYELAEDESKYATFYESHSKSIKLGVHEDDQNREKLAGLLRFRSSSMVQSFAAADPTTVSMDMFGAKVTVFANTGATEGAMAMAEFMYTRLAGTGKLTNYQEVQRGMGLTVTVTSTGLTVTTTADAYITVVSMLMF